MDQQAPAPAAPQAQPSNSQPTSAIPPLTPPSAVESPDAGEFATRFAGLQKQSRKLLEEQTRLKQERLEMSEKIKRAEEYDRAMKLKEDDPESFLQQFGLTYSGLGDKLIARRPSTEEKLERLEKRLEEDRLALQSKAQEAEAQEEQQIIDGFKNSIQEHVKAQAEKYELVSTVPGGSDLVFQVIEEYWNEHETIPDLETAMQHVEDYLTEQVKPFLSLKKFAAKSEPQDDKAAYRPTEKAAPGFTLTNQATAAPEATQRQGYMSDEESKKYAASLIRWN